MSRLTLSFYTKTLLKFFLNFRSVLGFGVFLVLFFGLFSAIVLLKDSKSENQSQKKPFDYFPTSTTNHIVKHIYCTLYYNEKYEQAECLGFKA